MIEGGRISTSSTDSLRGAVSMSAFPDFQSALTHSPEITEMKTIIEKTKKAINNKLKILLPTGINDLDVLMKTVIDLPLDNLDSNLALLISQTKKMSKEIQKESHQPLIVLLSSLVQLNQLNNLTKLDNSELKNILQLHKQSKPSSTSQTQFPSVIMQHMPFLEEPIETKIDVCRICEFQVKPENLMKHSLACKEYHNAKYKLRQNNDKIERIVETLSVQSNLKKAIEALIEKNKINKGHIMDFKISKEHLDEIDNLIIELDSSPEIQQNASDSMMNCLIVALSERRDIIFNALLNLQDAINTQEVLPHVNDIFTCSTIHILPEPQHSISSFGRLKQLARGAFGRVSLCQKLSTGDFFAIKSIPKNEVSHRNGYSQLLMEKETMFKAMSPKVVRLFYTFQELDYIFLVMEFMPGGDLFNLLANVGSLDEDSIKFYGGEIASALLKLHEKGIIHCDIKPDNILIGEDGHLKLTDFGLSKMSFVNKTLKCQTSNILSSLENSLTILPVINENLTNFVNESHEHVHKDEKVAELSQNSDENDDGNQNGIPGTPNYLAPELIMGEKITPACDWWSYGCILYELVNGVPPFQGETTAELFEAITAGRFYWYDEYPNDDEDDDGYEPISPELKDLIKGLLNPNPKARYGKSDIINHPFFNGYPFDQHMHRRKFHYPQDTLLSFPAKLVKSENNFEDEKNSEAKVPFKPVRRNSIDTSYFSNSRKSLSNISSSTNASCDDFDQNISFNKVKFNELWDSANYYALHEINMENAKNYLKTKNTKIVKIVSS